VSITEHLLRPLLAKSGARPLITHYDDAVGSRVELSVSTTANWAAKTANWLVEEVDVEPGDEVSVHLPAHWQTAGVLLGAWWCGAHVVTTGEGARIAFVGPDVPAGVGTAVVALDTMGMGLRQPPANGAVDYLSDVRLAGDNFQALFPIPGDTPALNASTVDDLLAEARSRAEKLGLSGADRVLSTIDWTQPDGILDGFLVPLAAGAHLVHVSNADPAKLDDRRQAERTTRDLT
jgi:uncharacterized protein (TIGR03089 family)